MSFSQEGSGLDAVNARVEQQSAAVRRFFAASGFRPSDISDSGVSFNRANVTNDEGQRVETRVTVTRSVELRTAEVLKASAAHERLPALLRDGADGENSNASGSPFQKVRVVTSVDYDVAG